MAKFKKARAARRFGGFARRTYRRAGKASGSPVGLAVMAAAYGAVRPTLQNATSGITGMLPVPYANNIAYGLVGYMLSKKGGMMGNAGKAMLVTEAAIVGSQLGGSLMGGASTTQSSTVGAWQ